MLLLLSEILFPGWRVSLDSKQAQLLRVNYLLRGLELSAGKHRVEFRYCFQTFLLGAIISATTLLTLLTLILR